MLRGTCQIRPDIHSPASLHSQARFDQITDNTIVAKSGSWQEERSEEESVLSDMPCVPPSDLKDKVRSLFPTHPVLGLEVTAKHLDDWLSMKQKEDVSSMIASGNFIRF